jgi:hypothetical protein
LEWVFQPNDTSGGFCKISHLGQAKASTFSSFLGGEKRLKNLSGKVSRYTWPVITNAKHHVIARSERGVILNEHQAG